MLILLPPSEGKTAPASGPSTRLEDLSHPRLNPARQRVGDALTKVSGQRNAMEVLGVGQSLAQEVERNRTLWANPADAAARIYTGVLYEAARMAQWNPEQLTRAKDRVRILSALWGALAPTDLIPAYRLPMSTSLGRLGPLAAYWRKHLTAPLTELAGDGLVVDCRSGGYIAAWRPADPARWVQVRVEREVNGRRSVVSHHAKHTRGHLAGHLALASSVPTTREDLADAASALVGAGITAVELTPAGLNLVVS